MKNNFKKNQREVRYHILSKRMCFTYVLQNSWSEHFSEFIRKNCHWSTFFLVLQFPGNFRKKYPYLVRLWENAEQENSKYGNFLCTSKLLRMSKINYLDILQKPCKLSNFLLSNICINGVISEVYGHIYGELFLWK